MEDDFEHIGARLKAAREASGWTIEDVLFRTQLPRSAVLALESDDFSAFTSPVYAKSFLAQYSRFLNVDAQPWLEALEPGSFVPGCLIQPLLDAPTVSPIDKPPSSSESRGGWLAVLSLLVLSAALVVAAIKGFDFFESRFGSGLEDRLAIPPQPAAEDPILNPPDRRPGAIREDEEISKPPPRAIIVR